MEAGTLLYFSTLWLNLTGFAVTTSSFVTVSMHCVVAAEPVRFCLYCMSAAKHSIHLTSRYHSDCTSFWPTSLPFSARGRRTSTPRPSDHAASDRAALWSIQVDPGWVSIMMGVLGFVELSAVITFLAELKRKVSHSALHFV